MFQPSLFVNRCMPMLDRSSPVAWAIMSLILAFAAACTPAIAEAAEGERERWTIWMSPQAAGMWPLSDYQPPGPEPAWGAAGHIVLQPSRSSFGLRFAIGFTKTQVEPESVQVIWGQPIFSITTPLSSLKAGNDLRWAAAGFQWDPRPQRSSAYVYAVFGVMYVSPVGTARVPTTTGCIDCRIELPGLAGSSIVPMFASGVGSRVLLGENKNLGITGEVEYLHAGAVDQVGPAGVEGLFPDTHFAIRHGAIGAISARLGLSVRR